MRRETNKAIPEPPPGTSYSVPSHLFLWLYTFGTCDNTALNTKGFVTVGRRLLQRYVFGIACEKGTSSPVQLASRANATKFQGPSERLVAKIRVRTRRELRVPVTEQAMPGWASPHLMSSFSNTGVNKQPKWLAGQNPSPISSTGPMLQR